MIHYTLYIIFFFFGLCVGSFLNAVIYRLEVGESIVLKLKRQGKGTKSLLKGLSPFGRLARSHCPHCKATLKWHDLVPVLSFIFLRGKCRYCGEKISWQYPIVEIATGIIFLLISNFEFRISNQILITEFLNGHWSLVIGYFLQLIYWLYIASALIVIFVYDFKHYLIPDKVLFPAIVVSIMYHVLSIMYGQNYTLYIILHTLYSYLGSALGASAFFLALVLATRGRGMGLGDVKLAFLMGLVLGWPNILVALFLAFLLGSIVGLGLVLISGISISGGPTSAGGRTSQNWNPNYSLKSQIPFGPFLIAGTFIALFWGSQIVGWYWGLLF